MRNLLGISAYYHDSAAVLLVDGRIVAAAQEVEKNNELFLDVLDVLDGKKPMGMPVPAGQSAVVDRVRFGNLLQNRAMPMLSINWELFMISEF